MLDEFCIGEFANLPNIAHRLGSGSTRLPLAVFAKLGMKIVSVGPDAGAVTLFRGDRTTHKFTSLNPQRAASAKLYKSLPVAKTQ